MTEQNTSGCLQYEPDTNEETDVESVGAKTDDSLLNTRSNSETTSISKDSSNSACGRNARRKCGSCCSLTTGIFLTVLGSLLLVWTPFHIFMEERLNMMPGLPPFDWWHKPPDEVYLSAFIFNVTNSEAFMNGTANKLNIQEIGPIVYLEKLRHSNITFNANGTLSYVSSRSAIYIPQENTIDLNTTIIVPNYAVLAMASHLHDASFFTKIAFNMLLRGVKSPIFIKTTIYNFLWNLTDPILSVAKHFAPEIVQSENFGVLDTIYRNMEDIATVYIGSKNGHEKFFLLDKFNGIGNIAGHDSLCDESVVNSTEGALYPQYITKNMTLRYWRKTLCRVVILHYEMERYMNDYNVLAYKFTKANDSYDRKTDLSQDCYKGEPYLPSGLSDVSTCYHGIAMAASFPHYLYGSPEIQNFVVGLKPNKPDHESYVFLEPLTGIPIESVARSQSNLIVKDMSGFTADVQKFNNTALPMFWLEYNQRGLPGYVTWLMVFMVNTIPKYQYYFIGLLWSVGILLLIGQLKVFKRKDNQKNYKSNTNMEFESDSFLKSS